MIDCSRNFNPGNQKKKQFLGWRLSIRFTFHFKLLWIDDRTDNFLSLMEQTEFISKRKSRQCDDIPSNWKPKSGSADAFFYAFFPGVLLLGHQTRRYFTSFLRRWGLPRWHSINLARKKLLWSCTEKTIFLFPYT